MSDRRHFLRTIAAWLLALLAAPSLSSCGGEESGASDESADGSCGNGAAISSIVDNHGHGLITIPSSELNAAGDTTLFEILDTGSAGHNHLVTITEAQKTTLLGGGTITQDIGHHSNVAITC